MTIIVFQSDGLLQEGSTNLKLIELKVSKLKKDVFSHGPKFLTIFSK